MWTRQGLTGSGRPSVALVLSAADVEACLPTAREQVHLVIDALTAQAHHLADMPPKVVVHPRPGATGEAMPVRLAVDGELLGVNWVTAYPSNRDLGLPQVNGVVLLNDPETGSLLAVIDAGVITAASMAAVTAVAVQRFTPGAGTVAILGAGVQARAHLAALAALGLVRSTVIYDRHPERSEELCAWAHERLSVAAEPATSAGAATRSAQLVVTCASRGGGHRQLSPADVADALLVVSMDEDVYLSPEVVRASHWFVVDDQAQFANARMQGFTGFRKPDESLAEALAAPGEPRPNRVVFLALGTGVCDLALANAAFGVAAATGRGARWP
jgi:ornithine cyclodeaminase/alanine dehydrogenase-like protein (mu-crystallin family)